MKAGAPQWSHRFNRNHISMLPTARSRWKTLVQLLSKWPCNPPDKPAFAISGSPVTPPHLNTCSMGTQPCTDHTSLHSQAEHSSLHFCQQNLQVLQWLTTVFASVLQEFNTRMILNSWFRKKSLIHKACNKWEVHDPPHPNLIPEWFQDTDTGKCCIKKEIHHRPATPCDLLYALPTW